MLPFDEGRFRVARARRLEEASVRAGGRGCGEEGVGLRLVPRGLLRPREGPDCCGVYLMGSRVLRYTLYELLRGPKPGYEYLKPEDVEKIPLPELRRKLREHKGFYDEIAKHSGATIFIDSNGKVLAIVYADPRESAVESSLRALKTVVKLFFS
jgi:hypothetical protein